jgi:NADPH-dependent 2,4-dienoyl-CoA reductase/sulfur reductase-like enzyme
MLPQVMPSLDPEMVFPLQEYLKSNGVKLHLGDRVARFEGNARSGVTAVVTESGARFPADLVVLGMGVRPETKLAREAGLEIGKLGGIRVDDQMHTSDKNIWAVGDAVEVEEFITREWILWRLHDAVVKAESQRM